MPYVTVLTGKLRGATLSVESEIFSIGRQATNDLEIPDLSVSRQHCVIEVDRACSPELRYRVRDLGSANGVKVNGRRVLESVLDAGDRLEIGDCALLFAEDEPASCQADEVAAFASTVRLHHDEILNLGRDFPEGLRLGDERYEADLRSLVRLAIGVNESEYIAAMEHRFLGLLLERIPAQFAAIVLDRGKSATAPQIARVCFQAEGEAGAAAKPVLSTTMILRVMESREPLLAVADSPDLRGIESLSRSLIRSLMVVPMLAGKEVLGVAYLASPAPDVFDRYHLRFAAAATAIATPALERGYRIQDLERSNSRLLSEIRIRHEVLGASPAIRKALEVIERVCRSDTPVLICGESGTGKELAARAIHLNSPRAEKALVAINCAALSETLIESELFGHERGAFTGAITQKRGVFEQARNGTLFLDEIAELPLQAQAKLLRVLERREITRIGGERSIALDFRFVAATNRNLAEAVRAGAFRADLYYRLNVVSLEMPPLRQRGDDILLLANYFLEQFRGKTGRHVLGFSPAAYAHMLRYDWPGNVRELRNAIERAVMIGAAPHIEPEDLPDSLGQPASPDGTGRGYTEGVRDARRRIVLQAFASADGLHSRAAELLSLHPNNLYRVVNELGIRDQVAATKRSPSS